MATDPYGIQLGIPQIQGAGVLAGMQPLSFAAAASPVQVQPLAGWQMPQMQAPPSTHPEAIAEGIAKGIDAITKGITAKRTQKREDENLKKKQEREDALRAAELEETRSREDLQFSRNVALNNIKFGQQKELAGIQREAAEKSQKATFEQQDKQQATHGKAQIALEKEKANRAEALARLNAAGGIPKENVTHVTGEKTNVPKEPPITIEWSKPLQAPPVSLDSKAPPIQLQQQVAPLASIAPPSNAPFQFQPSLNEKGQFTPASAAPLGAMPLPSQGLQLPATLPAPEMKLEARFDENGNWVPGAAQSNPAGQPAMPQPTPSTQAGAMAGIKAPAIDPYKYNGKIVDAESKALIDNAAREMGLKVKFTETKENNWKVADIDDTAKKEAAKQTQLDKKETDKERALAVSVMAQAQRLENSNNEIKAYTGPNGVKSMLPAVISAYDRKTSGESKAFGIDDITLLDNFSRAEGGGKITEGQVTLIKNATSLKDQLALIPKKWLDGDVLSQNAIDEMTRIIVKSHNEKAEAANEAAHQINYNAMQSGVLKEPPAKQYNDVYYVKKDVLTKELPSIKASAIRAKQNYDFAMKNGDQEAAQRELKIGKDLAKQFETLSKAASESKSAVFKIKKQH
jgi:hypothetical protein